MVQRQGTILKKCQSATRETCGHKWTLRFWADGRQRELSFADELDSSGRPRYGSGRRLAQDAQLKIAHDKRARVFIDPKLGSARFGDECEKWINRHAVTELTTEAYRSILRAHVGPVLGGVGWVCGGRGGARRRPGAARGVAVIGAPTEGAAGPGDRPPVSLSRLLTL